MNLLLDHALKFNEQAKTVLERSMTRVIVVDQESETAYGWVSYHPETNSIAQILFHDQPEPTSHFDEKPF